MEDEEGLAGFGLASAVEGRWRMEEGGWRNEDGRWRKEDGGRKMEGGGITDFGPHPLLPCRRARAGLSEATNSFRLTRECRRSVATFCASRGEVNSCRRSRR